MRTFSDLKTIQWDDLRPMPQAGWATSSSACSRASTAIATSPWSWSHRGRRWYRFAMYTMHLVHFSERCMFPCKCQTPSSSSTTETGERVVVALEAFQLSTVRVQPSPMPRGRDQSGYDNSDDQ
jgi:hypothetical protein